VAGKPKATQEAETAAKIAGEQEVAEENKNLKRNNFGVKIAENIDGEGHNKQWGKNGLLTRKANSRLPTKFRIIKLYYILILKKKRKVVALKMKNINPGYKKLILNIYLDVFR